MRVRSWIAVTAVAVSSLSLEGSTNELVNGKFLSSVSSPSSWHVVGNVAYNVYWSAAGGHVTTGAAGVHFPGAGAYTGTFLKQCVGVLAGHSYSFGVWFQYPSSVQTVPTGSIQVHWNSSTSCTPASD